MARKKVTTRKPVVRRRRKLDIDSLIKIGSFVMGAVMLFLGIGLIVFGNNIDEEIASMWLKLPFEIFLIVFGGIFIAGPSLLKAWKGK